jgi:hypothetical protein
MGFERDITDLLSLGNEVGSCLRVTKVKKEATAP